MNFPKANSFPKNLVLEKIMGPNPLKLCEEMMAILDDAVGVAQRGTTPSAGDVTLSAQGASSITANGNANSGYAAGKAHSNTSPNNTSSKAPSAIPEGSIVMDLGSGTGITSALLSREFGLVTYACDLWSDPTDNLAFFDELGISKRQAIPLKMDATTPFPFAKGFFDAVLSTDSYHYFGRDAKYLDEILLPCIKQGGIVAFCVPGMKKDCHDNPPECLLRAWGAEQLDYIHDAKWWRNVVEQSRDSEVLAIKEMSCTEEAWNDWLECDNEYARGDKLAIEAGALSYLNSITVVLRKK